MSRSVFVDTAGWVMLADGSDPMHEAARRARDQHMEAGGVWVTTDYVADETLTLLRMRLGLEVSEKWWKLVEESPRIQWEQIDPRRAERARDWFYRWRDKQFSFTDCTSFVVMKERHLSAALTSDVHFVQAGFERLPT